MVGQLEVASESEEPTRKDGSIVRGVTWSTIASQQGSKSLAHGNPLPTPFNNQAGHSVCHAYKPQTNITYGVPRRATPSASCLTQQTRLQRQSERGWQGVTAAKNVPGLRIQHLRCGWRRDWAAQRAATARLASSC